MTIPWWRYGAMLVWPMGMIVAVLISLGTNYLIGIDTSIGAAARSLRIGILFASSLYALVDFVLVLVDIWTKRLTVDQVKAAFRARSEGRRGPIDISELSHVIE